MVGKLEKKNHIKIENEKERLCVRDAVMSLVIGHRRTLDRDAV